MEVISIGSIGSFVRILVQFSMFQAPDENTPVNGNSIAATGFFGRPFSSVHIPRNR